MNDRGLAAGIMRFFVVAGMFGLFYVVFDQFAMDLFNGLGLSATTAKTTELQGYMSAMWTVLPAIVILILVVRLIARSVFESRGGVR